MIKKDFSKLQPVLVDRVKLNQILVNLIRNATDALEESPNKEKLLIIATSKNQNKVCIQVSDNGVGISEENLSKICKHGFTTKKFGHGFGLHASALAAKEMAGMLKIDTAGIGK